MALQRLARPEGVKFFRVNTKLKGEVADLRRAARAFAAC